jgi:hypothetical protein
MPTVQLRRYDINPGELDGWVAHWRENVLPIRQQFGFTVLFAHADHVNSQFVWAVSYEGSPEALSARDREYHDSPEWAARNKGKGGPIKRATVAFVDQIWP